MDFINTALVTLKQPTGFWESILNAFKSATGKYILAVILLAVILRVLFSVVDVINKKISAKNSGIQAKMQPELDAVKKKYGNDPATLQKKQSEIYKKYQFSMMGSCLPMLIIMVLQLTVFLTLWNSLRDISNFNIVKQYEDMKNIYSTVITLNDNENVVDAVENGYELHLEIVKNDKKENEIKIYVTKESEVEGQDGELRTLDNEPLKNLKNEEIYSLLQKYVIEKTTDDEGNEIDSPDYQPENAEVSKKINLAAQTLINEYYKDTQESFLWIKNIYKAESPTSPLLTEGEMKNYLSGFYSKEEKALEKEFDYEGKIYGEVVSGIDTKALGNNGYYILTILAVLTSVLSLWLSNFLMRNKNNPAQKQPWLMYVIMPLIIGIFTFMYTSLFAIYLIVGQLMMLALTPLTTLAVKKWSQTEDKKKQDKNVIDVDYRRKDL